MVSRKSQPRFGARRLAREWAAQVLYQLDAQGALGDPARVDEALRLHRMVFALEEREEDAPDAEEAGGYCDALVKGATSRLAAVDAAIQTASQHWKLERMARVDRNILRLAAYELLDKSVPARVVINEGIEIAKRYGTEESGAFVNGILDRIAQEQA